PALAQLFIGLCHRVEELQLRIRQEAELDGGDRREIGRRDEIGNRNADRHGAFIPAAAAASFQSFKSSRMARANCSGVLHTASTPILSRRATKPGSLPPAAISRAMRSTISCGVPPGATYPFQVSVPKPG